MICENCKSEMIKDDIDYNFKGNFNTYWICEKCNTTCIEHVRFGKPFYEEWDYLETLKGAKTNGKL